MCIFIERNEHPVAVGWTEFDKRWYAVSTPNFQNLVTKKLNRMLKVNHEES